jgi:uncharacterized membrane protein YfcA
MNPINVLRVALIAITAVYGVVWGRDLKAATGPRFPSPLQMGIGYFTNFLDTLGIGSFATTTATYRLTKNVDDRIIPGTLNVGHTPPTTAQALIYTTLIQVDVITLFSMIAASILGSWLGAGVVARWSKQNVQIGMGVALLVAATIFFMQQLSLIPGGGADIGVRGFLLVVAVVVNFFLGALMTLGIGLYAPCMILVSLLGMNPTVAFPIMMGSCAFLMPVGSMRFIQEKSYSPRAALGLAIGGIPAVLMAAYIVKELPLYYVKWLVIVVVVYTSISMLRSAYRTVSAGSILEPRSAGM